MKIYLEKIISECILKLGYPAKTIQIEIPKDNKFGDFTTNTAMLLAKELKSHPRNIAQQITENLEYDKDLINKIEIAGAGFINFYISDNYYFRELSKILSLKNDYGKSEINTGKTANLEWVSANPTKPLHAGHGRQICLGKAIANLLEWSGYKLTREYYYNDAGNQMRILGMSVHARYEQIFNPNFPFPEDGYQGDYIKDIAEKIYSIHGDKYRNCENIDYFITTGEEYNFQSIRNTLEKLNIKHDIFFNESSLYENGAIEKLMSDFKSKKLSYLKDGAVWLKSIGEHEHEKDKVIQKATGEYTYRLPDMAYHIAKLNRNYDLIMDIFGADHVDTYREVLHGIGMLGYDISKIKVIIHQMVVFKTGKEKVKMSGRYGTFYSLDDLLEDIGKDATQFFFIMRGANSQLEFDIELAKEQSDKNPVYYLQYAHARICGILRHAGEVIPEIDKLLETSVDFKILNDKYELELLKQLTKFPDEVESASLTYEPHKIITYLNKTAECFHVFYRNNKVIIPSNINLTLARLKLCLSVKQVLKNGFNIIGISAPERMERTEE
ncbi:MAG: arginine--tRNA ligase [Ignavibacteria bacterium]|nr:arginine--tRNA ligase [Ignavibacteria bacterium]